MNDSRYSNGKFTLKSKGAKTLSINFSNFTLPKGTEMYVYNKDAEMITGVITDAENNEAKVWGSSIYKGDEINIEIKVPVEEKEKLSLQITNVAYGYKNILIEKVAGFGLSGGCNINVLCPAGNNWVGERNSVVYIARSNGDALCSGAMLMNTCATNIPYVLTANHCFVGDGNVAGWRVHFQAWSATCPNPGTNSDGILFNGSTLRANWAPSDFCLVRLNQTPAANSGIHYAGWSRATTAATSGVSIHHPSGDVMKISTYTTPLIREDNPARCNVNPVGELQWVVQWNQGVTEGGSSGSPLFDQNHRIVGQLSGGPSSCAQPANCRIDMYGRFDNSWTGGGTNATRLSNWLNPSNYGVLTTNTTNVSNLTNASPALSISGNSALCSSGSYTLNGATAGTISWTSSNTSIATVTQGNPATVTRVGNGAVNITATVTFCPNVTTAVTKTISVGVPNNYYIQSMSMNSTNRLDIYPSFTGYQMSVTSWSVYVDGSFSTSGSGYPPSVISVYASCGSHDVTLTTSNSCGSYSTSSYYSGSGCYALTPNPANENVTITDMAVSSKSVSTGGKTLASIGSKVTITVFDNTNRPLKQFTFSQSSRYNFSVADLTPGTYIVQIKQNGSVNSLKMIKE